MTRHLQLKDIWNNLMIIILLVILLFLNMYLFQASKMLGFLMVYFRNNKWSSSNDVITLEKIRLYTFSDQVITFWNKEDKLPVLCSSSCCMRMVLLSYLWEMVKRIGIWELIVEQTHHEFMGSVADKEDISVCGLPVTKQFSVTHSDIVVINWSKI